ncbi:hypothetical protein [Desulforhopalus sp. IMCC35007]|uniref:hypothetical protein n=1 Tax=Desulforhopalus sp. IMCC35007 TaxID=2569543 RepID=UPI0010AE850E|nr:hypothetical protein [Desulforhopalus sp. IMCC35007]TKB06317.1 hypothetical protein FCL48_21415 [Desulforhopalus sp. IMCC35007]
MDKIMKLWSLIALCCFLLVGCARFIVPEAGTISHVDSRIAYSDEDKQDGVFTTKDMILEYSLIQEENGARFTGELVFDRSLTDSYPVLKTFFLKMSWVDNNGAVLMTSDVTPFFSHLAGVPNKLKIDKKIETVSGSKYIIFNYFGVFRGQKPDVSDEWSIFYFPFERS